jgi:hypothetical protein
MKYLLFALFAVNTFALETLVLGGGGDPVGDKTIFDSSLQELFNKRSELKLKTNVVFNGNHKETESIITKATGAAVKPFTEENYNNIVKEYIRKIEAGEIKTGEKLLVYMDTHGGEKADGVDTHSIAMGGTPIKDFSRIDGGKGKSMDVLAKLAEVAKTKNIKLAIMDFSCHSGNSLALANSNTCVITSSGPNHFGYTGFASYMIEAMKPGRSLEDAFLEARKRETMPSFPMISTEAGKRISSDLYRELSPYLFYKDQLNGMAIDKLSPYLSKVVETSGWCQRENDFKNLITKLETFEKLAGKLYSEFSGGEPLVAKLKEYKKLQDTYLKELKDSGFELLKTKEKIYYGGKKDKNGKIVGQESSNESWDMILTSYDKGNLNYFKERLKTVKSPQERADILKIVDKYNKIYAKREEILKKYPKILNYKETFDKMLASKNKLMDLSRKVTELGNKYYDNAYSVHMNAISTSEPCRDFKL